MMMYVWKYSKLLGEGDLRIMTQLISNIYKTGQWPKDFTEVTTIALKKPKAMKCRNHCTISCITCTISCITCTAKIVVRMRSRRIEQKTEDELGDQFEFRKGKGTREASRMLRISDQTLDTDEELCACFIDWQMALDHVTWTKLMQVLKETSSTGERKIRVLEYKWTKMRQ